MQVRLHVPLTLTAPEGYPPDQRTRLLRTVTAAIERAAAALVEGRPDVTVEVVAADVSGRTESRAPDERRAGLAAPGPAPAAASEAEATAAGIPDASGPAPTRAPRAAPSPPPRRTRGRSKLPAPGGSGPRSRGQRRAPVGPSASRSRRPTGTGRPSEAGTPAGPPGERERPAFLVIDEPLPGEAGSGVLVFRAGGPGGNVQVVGSPYYLTDDLALAIELGRTRFGRHGFAVLEPRPVWREKLPRRFVVARASEPLSVRSGPLRFAYRLPDPIDEAYRRGDVVVVPSREEALGDRHGLRVIRPTPAPDSSIPAHGVSAGGQGYVSVVTVSEEGVPLWNDPPDWQGVATREAIGWRFAEVLDALGAPPVAAPAAAPRGEADLVRRRRDQRGGPGPVVALYRTMEAGFFAALPWRDRIEAIAVLLGEGLREDQDRQAVIRIVRSIPNVAEFEATIAELRRRRLYDALLEAMGSDVGGLLREFAGFASEDGVDWAFVRKTFAAAANHPQATLNGLREWLMQKLARLRDLLDPRQWYEAAKQVLELSLILGGMLAGDPRDEARLRALLGQYERLVLDTFKGLRVATVAGLPPGERSGRANEEVAERLAFGVVLELAFQVLLLVMMTQFPVLIPVLSPLAWFTPAQVGRVAARGSRAAAGLLERTRSLLGAVSTELTRVVERLSAGRREVGWLEDLFRKGSGDEVERFLSSLKFVEPEHLARWPDEVVGELFRRPLVRGLAAERGGVLLDVALRRAGGDWDLLERLAAEITTQRAAVRDPAAFLDLLDRLVAGEDGAWNPLLARAREGHAGPPGARPDFDDPRRPRAHEVRTGEGDAEAPPPRPEQPAPGPPLAPPGEGAAEVRARLKTLGLTGLDEVAEALVPLRLTDKQLHGLSVIEKELGGAASLDNVEFPDYLDHVVEIGGYYHTRLFDAVAEIATVGDEIRPPEGLHEVLRNLFWSPDTKAATNIGEPLGTGEQGALGTLDAALDLRKQYPGRRIRFEVVYPNPGQKSGARHIDIIVEGESGPIHAEVKTYLKPKRVEAPGGKAVKERGLKLDREQVRKDLVINAENGFERMLNLFHPDMEESLPAYRRKVLEMFDTDPELRSVLRARSAEKRRLAAAVDQALAEPVDEPGLRRVLEGLAAREPELTGDIHRALGAPEGAVREAAGAIARGQAALAEALEPSKARGAFEGRMKESVRSYQPFLMEAPEELTP